MTAPQRLEGLRSLALRIRSAARPLLAGALGVAVVVGAVLLVAWGRPPAEGRPPVASPAPVPVEVAPVTRGALAATLSVSGNVEAKRQVTIVPLVAGRVRNIAVDVGSAVKAGDVLVELEPDALSRQVAQAEGALAAAQAKLDALRAGPRAEEVAVAAADLAQARARLAALEAGPRPEQVLIAELNLYSAKQRFALMERGGRPEQIAQAEAALEAAKARRDEVKRGATSYDVDQARLAVDLASSQLRAAQAQRDQTCAVSGSPSPLCDAANAQVAAAQTAVQQAQSRYAQVRAGGSAEQVAQAEAAVRQAEQQLALARQPFTSEELNQASAAVRAAEAQFALAKRPATEHDLAQARAAVDAVEQQLALARRPATIYDRRALEAATAQAQAGVDLARSQLAEATLRAPFHGLVARRMVEVGTLAGPTVPALTLISTATEIVVNVGEGDLAALKTGQAATLRTSAYPGREFSATVTSVAPALDARTRAAPVRLAPLDPDGALREGMFARVEIPVAGADGALLVPARAIAQEGRDAVVYVVRSGAAERRVVTVGPTDGERTAILRGLVEGELVAASATSGLADGQAVAIR